MTTTVTVDAHAGWAVQAITVMPGSVQVHQVDRYTKQDTYLSQGCRVLLREVPNGDGSSAERQTPGEYRVGISFNPSGHAQVEAVKALAAMLIDAIQAVTYTSKNPEHMAEVDRLKEIAVTAAEDAAMWGVKAATKGVR